MPTITIREHGRAADHFSASVRFDGEGEYSASIRDPFGTPGDPREQELEWYFERWIRSPYTDEVRARHAASSIAAFGEDLFKQVFADPDAYARYVNCRSAGLTGLRFEIAGSPEFHALHWESLKDPGLPRPLVLQATMVRKMLQPEPVQATLRPSPTINVLVVTARPQGERDVAYRTISRPLVEGLRRTQLPMQIDILRPGTYQALVQHLEDVRSRADGAGGTIT